MCVRVCSDENRADTLASRWFDANYNEGVKRSVFQHIFMDCLESYYRSLAKMPFYFSDVERDDTEPSPGRALSAMVAAQAHDRDHRGGYDPRFPVYSACKAFWKKQQADENAKLAHDAVSATSALMSHIATTNAALAAAAMAGGAGAAAAQPTSPTAAAAAAGADSSAPASPSSAGASAAAPAAATATAPVSAEAKRAAEIKALAVSAASAKRDEPTAEHKANNYAWDLLLVQVARHLQGTRDSPPSLPVSL